MILELDAGNTSIKWRVVNEEGAVQAAAERVLQEGLDTAADRWAEFGISKARVSCVAGQAVSDVLDGVLSKALGVAARFAETQKLFDGLEISYEDPARLGVDRWLAMLAARRISDSSCCVIDCGSAITVDAVRGDGVHRGGYIVPGLRLMRRALLGDTKQIKMDSRRAESATRWGTSTDQAVNFGICRMAVGLIESVVDELNVGERQCNVYLTGGDAGVIHSMLRSDLDTVIVPELVLDGLAIALP